MCGWQYVVHLKCQNCSSFHSEVFVGCLVKKHISVVFLVGTCMSHSKQLLTTMLPPQFSNLLLQPAFWCLNIFRANIVSTQIGCQCCFLFFCFRYVRACRSSNVRPHLFTQSNTKILRMNFRGRSLNQKTMLENYEQHWGNKKNHQILLLLRTKKIYTLLLNLLKPLGNDLQAT